MSFLSVIHPLRIPIPMSEKKSRVQQENSYKITYCLRVFPTQVLQLDLGLLRLEAWLQEVDMWLKRVIVCVVPKLQGLVFQCKPCSPGRKSRPLVKGWEVGCLLLWLFFPAVTSCTSWCSLLWKWNERARPLARQACARVCPSPQSSLATGPRFVETWGMTARGRYVIKESDSLCGAKTAGFSIPMQTLPPQGEKVAHWSGRSLAWGVCSDSPPQRWCVDRRVYQAGVIRTSHTNFTFHLVFLIAPVLVLSDTCCWYLVASVLAPGPRQCWHRIF